MSSFKPGDRVRFKVLTAKEAYETTKESGKNWFGWTKEMTAHAEQGTIFIVWDSFGPNSEKIPIREDKDEFTPKIFNVIAEWIQPESAPRKFKCNEPWEQVRLHGCRCGAADSEQVQQGKVWCNQLRMWVKP